MSNIKSPYVKRYPPLVVGVRPSYREPVGRIHDIVLGKARAYDEEVIKRRNELQQKARTGDQDAIKKLFDEFRLKIIILSPESKVA